MNLIVGICIGIVITLLYFFFKKKDCTHEFGGWGTPVYSIDYNDRDDPDGIISVQIRNCTKCNLAQYKKN